MRNIKEKLRGNLAFLKKSISDFRILHNDFYVYYKFKFFEMLKIIIYIYLNYKFFLIKRDSNNLKL